MSITTKYRVVVLHALVQMPGQTAGDYREILGVPERVVGHVLRTAARRGDATSTVVDGRKIWFR